ncbi:hypothetical protein SR39_06540 [Methylobacterium radiotolerans]|nr:hypothetical protein SR39_06540 [Methylobacterium radiotolerans]
MPERLGAGSRASVIEADLESTPARRRTVRDRWRAGWTHQVAAATRCQRVAIRARAARASAGIWRSQERRGSPTPSSAGRARPRAIELEAPPSQCRALPRPGSQTADL